MKSTLALIFAFVVAGIVATAGSAAAMERSGTLHVTKECSQYTFTAGSFCTITSSNIHAIKPGMRAVYLAAPVNGVLDSDLVLSFAHGSAAFGHVRLDFTTLRGRVTFSGGTGKFTGFHADTVVSLDSTGRWHWDGTYSFTGSDGKIH
jgi:hypothetical protein